MSDQNKKINGSFNDFFLQDTSFGLFNTFSAQIRLVDVFEIRQKVFGIMPFTYKWFHYLVTNKKIQ